MRFDTLYSVYNFMAYICGFAEDNDGFISFEEIMAIYRADLPTIEVSYNYDISEDWGVSLDCLQHVCIYRTSKEGGYYLVIRGFENMEELKNE